MKRKDLNYMRNLTLGFDSFVHDEWGYGGDDRHLNLDKGASTTNITPMIIGTNDKNVSGFRIINMPHAINMTLKKYGYNYWWEVMVAAAIIFVFGILLLFNPFDSLILLIRMLGIFLAIDGLANLLTVLSYTKIEKAIK